MLDRASLRALAQHPERNDPMLNVALAEEGDAPVLLALAECPVVGPEALAKISARVASEGEEVGREPEPEREDALPRGSRRAEDERSPVTHGTDLDARLVIHPRAEDAVRDAILARHPDDPFFVLAAAAHSRATATALERVARWPGTTPLHDRPWLALIRPECVPPLLLDQWGSEDDALARESAARLSRDPARLARLAGDPSRRVRRAVASNPSSGSERERLAARDEACEVRARAASPAEPSRDDGHTGGGATDVDGAAFRASLAAMKAGGTLSADVVRALRAGPLDPEGARLAARALDEASIGSLVASRPLRDDIGLALAAGIAMRDDVVLDDGTGSDLLGSCIHALASADRSGGVVTGKARLGSWLAEGLAEASGAALDEVVDALGRPTLAADRMVLGRLARQTATLIPVLVKRAVDANREIPVALLELAWRHPDVDERTLASLAAHARAPRKLDASPEHEADLDPRARPLDVLERVGSALVNRVPLSPRAALTLVALEPRRVRYVLSAMPQWKGLLAGVNVARVLRSHAGALSAAGSSGGRRASTTPASWTQRRLDEVESAVALAIGDLPPKDAALRIASGQNALLFGTALAAGMEARAALDGPTALEPLVELLSRTRRQDAGPLAAWLLIEGLDRTRSAAALAAALDAPWASTFPTRPGGGQASPRAMVAPGIAEALATLERRAPGRLAEVTPQTPRGRAALVSGIARAYRALGGMSVSET